MKSSLKCFKPVMPTALNLWKGGQEFSTMGATKSVMLRAVCEGVPHCEQC